MPGRCSLHLLDHVSSRGSNPVSSSECNQCFAFLAGGGGKSAPAAEWACSAHIQRRHEPGHL